jgi:hypothetical protein
MAVFAVIRTPPFNSLVADAAGDHAALDPDLDWLIGRLGTDPQRMGDHVTNLAKLRLPIFKTRCKDSCHSLGASSGWRIYYALDKDRETVFLLFLHHKKEYELPRQGFLLQKLERALPDA